MSTHITTLALRNNLPKGCNGEGAAHEFARHLLPSVRAALLNPSPAPVPDPAAVGRAFVAAIPLHVMDEEAPEPREQSTACPRCHEDAGYHKTRCAHCGVKRGRRLRAVRTYGISFAETTTEAA